MYKKYLPTNNGKLLILLIINLINLIFNLINLIINYQICFVLKIKILGLIYLPKLTNR